MRALIIRKSGTYWKEKEGTSQNKGALIRGEKGNLIKWGKGNSYKEKGHLRK